jgi:DNA mismatch repair protein MutS2
LNFAKKKGQGMDERSIRLLEFDKIKKKVMAYAVSDMAKEKLDALIAMSDYDGVLVAIKETNDALSFIKRRGLVSMEGICDISMILKRAKMGGVLNPFEFLRISDNIKIALRLKEHLSKDGVLDEDNGMERSITHLISHKVLLQKITHIFISENEIADDASDALYSIRRLMIRLQENIKAKLSSILQSQSQQKYLQDPLVTIRNDRYVLPVKQEFKNEIPGLIHDASASGATLFIEPLAVVQMNNAIKEAKIQEKEEIRKILTQLTQEVGGIADELINNQECLCQIDYVAAKAKYAKDTNAIAPRITRETKMKIVKGRHPLLNPETIVPIDFWIGEDFKTLIITGPNTGGKTVALKTVGLFILMAQSGLLIPAQEGTTLGVFENVFVDIGDEQSIEQSLSTFSSHMTHIVGILKCAKANDLVLLDELGAGTDPTEGAALALAILKELINRGATTVATTHYSELKSFALKEQGVKNASCAFDVESLKPTYEISIGLPGKSNAFAISQKLGLSPWVLQTAKDLMKHQDVLLEDVMASLEHRLKEADANQKITEEILKEVEEKRRKMQIEMEEMEHKKKTILQKAREEVRQRMHQALREVEDLQKELRNATRQNEKEESQELARTLKKTLLSKIKEVNAPFSNEEMEEKDGRGNFKKEGLKKGSTVFVKSINTVATVLNPPDKNQNVLVQAGIMKVNVSLSDIKEVSMKDSKEAKGDGGISKIVREKTRQIQTEIHLRGYQVDEAVLELDKYLDDAKLSGLKEVRIIHGKGTGALRLGIHQFLKTHPHVDGFRQGAYGEGESGVTVVMIK